LDKKTFAAWKLSGMLKCCFDGSPYKALEATYPGEYAPWELRCAPQSFWNINTGVQATKWLIEEKLRWSRTEICERFDRQTLRQNNLDGMLSHCFDSSPYKALNATYPGEYHPWELQNTPKDFWTLDTSVRAVKWLIEERLSWDRLQVCDNLVRKVFTQHGLGGMLYHCFNGSPFRAIDATYPNEYNPWELRSTPKAYWTVETGKAALSWLLDEKLNWSADQAKSKLTYRIVKDNGLSGMLGACFDGSVKKALQCLYSPLESAQ